MKKLFLLIITTCITSLGAWGQTSSVSATITDSTSQAYANGTYDILFRPAPGVPGNSTQNGSAFTKHFSGVLDASGAFAVTLTRNDFVQPGGSQWTFTICPLAASACFTSNQTIAAASVNLTSALHTVTPIVSVFSLGNIPSAYSSSEIVVTPNPGSFFWNLSTNLLNFWNGSTWVAPITDPGEVLHPTDVITSSTPVRDIRAANFAGGAKCDGVTDDTTAIQAAVTAQNTLGGVVFIPPSLLGCGISATIISSSTAPVGIVGAGQGFSSLKALSTIAGPMFEKLDGFVGGRGLIQGVNFNCNQHAAESLLIESHRQLDMRDVGSQDCTSENEIFGKTGATNLVGLQAYNLNIDNTAIATANLASRPTYGLDLKNNVDDSEVNTLLVNHTQTAGMKIAGVNNHFVKIHPWGYGPSGTIPNSWPTYGIEVTGQENSFEGCEPDNIHTAGFKQSASRLVITGCTFGNGEAGNTPYMVEADAGTDTLVIHSNTTVGNWQNNPANFLGGSAGVHTYAFANGFLTATLFPSDLVFQAMSVKNASDAALYSIIDSGSTSAFDGMTEYRDRGTVKWRAGRNGSDNNYRIQDIVNGFTKLFLSSGGDVEINAQGTQPVRINSNTNAGTGGLEVQSGGGSPAVVALINGSGKATFNGGIDNSAQASSFLKIKDQGSCTMTTGSCSAQSLGHTYTAAPNCFANWNNSGTLTGILKVPSTTTTVTPASSVGTDTAVVNWFCIGS